MKRLSWFLAAVLAACALAPAAFGAPASTGAAVPAPAPTSVVSELAKAQLQATSAPNVAAPTPAQIRAWYQEHGVTLSGSAPTYDAAPSVSAPYDPGAPSDDTLQEALETLNFIRYVAGLDADVRLDPSLAEGQQAAAFVNAVNGSLSHFPDQPAGMGDELFQLGSDACSRSNLACGFFTLPEALVSAWLDDSDAYNVATLGHRRWLLNPSMGATGFGIVRNDASAYRVFESMYAFDQGNASASQSAVAWPAQNTPVELYNHGRVGSKNGFGTAWSVSMGSTVTASQVHVTIQDTDNKSRIWEFGEAEGDGRFYVDNQWFGRPGAIICLPEDMDVNAGDTYRVTVTGTSPALDYTVHFFSLEDDAYDEPGGTDPGDDPGTDPGDEPGDEPGGDPGDEPGGDPGTDPGTDPGDEPGGDPGTDPGTDPGDEPAVDFVDVPVTAYFADAVRWAVANGVTEGYVNQLGQDEFRPGAPCTRAQVVTFLYRAAGKPDVGSLQNPFADVPAGSYYEDAVKWAVSRGITTGVAPGSFKPDGTCTRAQVVTFLCRAYPKPVGNDVQNPFRDVASGDYFYSSVLWAVDNDVTTGVSPTLFNPQGECTRGHVVTFLSRAAL